jgi:2'-5' RNA ligase
LKSGIIVISELSGPLRELVLDIQRRFDPKLAANLAPHVTITGSSGMGPISTRTTPDELRSALQPVARATPPMTLDFGPPIRFMQTNVVVLPLSPYGELRALHDRIRNSALLYEQPRFTFPPHVTLSFFPQLTDQTLRHLMAVRVTEPVRVERIQCYETLDLTRTRKVLDLPLGEPNGEEGDGKSAGGRG